MRVKCGGGEILLICAIISWWVGFVTDQNKHGKILSQLCEIFSTNCVTLSLSFDYRRKAKREADILSSGGDSKYRTRRQEVGITIFVPDYKPK